MADEGGGVSNDIRELVARAIAACEDWDNPGRLADAAIAALASCSAVDAWPERCSFTRNPCGTDTWMAGRPCPCDACARWCLDHDRRAQLAATAAERDKYSEHLLAINRHLVQLGYDDEAVLDQVLAVVDDVAEVTAERDRIAEVLATTHAAHTTAVAERDAAVARAEKAEHIAVVLDDVFRGGKGRAAPADWREIVEAWRAKQ